MNIKSHSVAILALATLLFLFIVNCNAIYATKLSFYKQSGGNPEMLSPDFGAVEFKFNEYDLGLGLALNKVSKSSNVDASTYLMLRLFGQKRTELTQNSDFIIGISLEESHRIKDDDGTDGQSISEYGIYTGFEYLLTEKLSILGLIYPLSISKIETTGDPTTTTHILQRVIFGMGYQL